MTFDDNTRPKDLVKDVLHDHRSLIEFKKIKASHHECFKHFTNGEVMGSDHFTGENLIFGEGILMSTGKPEDFCWNDSNMQSHQWGEGGDEDLMSLHERADRSADRPNIPNSVPQMTYDACVIEFEFRCWDDSHQVSLGYIFGSEEYYEAASGDYNDAFAIFLNGKNIALLPDGETMVSIHDVNDDNNSEYFVSNESDGMGIPYPNIEADGFTTKLTAAGTIHDDWGWNKLKIVIADKSDNILDSYLMLQAQSFTCVNSKAPLEDASTSTVTTTSSPGIATSSNEYLDESITDLSDKISKSIDSNMKWYPNLYDPDNPYSCVYGDQYKDWMELESLTTQYLFSSEDECCSVHYCEDH